MTFYLFVAILGGVFLAWGVWILAMNRSDDYDKRVIKD